MALSISLLISLVIAVIAAWATLISFTPTYLAGVDGIQDAIGNLRGTMIDKTTTGVEKFFKGPADAIDILRHARDSGVMDLAHADDHHKLRLMCKFALEMDGVQAATWFEPHLDQVIGDIWMTFCDIRMGIPLAFNISTQPGALNNTGVSNVWPYDTKTEQLITSGVPFTKAAINRSYIIEAHEVNIAAYRITPYGHPTWTDAYRGYNSIQYSIVLDFYDRNGGQAYITVDVLPQSIKDFFNTLGLRKNARALAVDVKERSLLAVSWDEKTEQLLPNWQDLSAAPETRIKLKRVGDVEDKLIRQVWVDHLGGDDVVFDQKHFPTPHKSIMGTGSDRVFVDVANITDPYGLQLLILIAMPEKDFMEDVYATRTNTIIIIVCCLLAMIGLGVVFSITITRPINRIGHRMYLTASLQDESDDDVPSLLSEVREMQEAYGTMKAELNRMKSYLPQSVLCGNADADDEDEDDEGELGSRKTSGSFSAEGSNCNARKSGPSTPTNSDTQSRSSRASRAPNNGGGVGAVVSSLNTSTRALLQKKVVVAVFNLSEFHNATKAEALVGNKIVEIQSKFLSIVNKHVRDNKGVIDTFQGDHVVATFNALNNVASAGKRATLAANHVASEVSSLKHPAMPPVTIGIAMGPAIVGNMGISEMQRFNIVGRVYLHALAIERLAAKKLKEHNAAATAPAPTTTGASGAAGHDDLVPARPLLHHCLLVSQAVLTEISLEFYYECCDVIRLPGSAASSTTAPSSTLRRHVHHHNRKPLSVVARVECLKSVSQNEWMYMVEEGEVKDPYVMVNSAFAEFASGDLEGAKQHLAAAFAGRSGTPSDAELTTSAPTTETMKDTNDDHHQAPSLMMGAARLQDLIKTLESEEHCFEHDDEDEEELVINAVTKIIQAMTYE